MLKRYERAAKHQMGYQVEVEENRQFYKGNQWLIRRDGRFMVPRRKKWQVRLTTNKLPPIVESIIATFLNVDPIIQAFPTSNEDIDRKASKVVRQVLRAYHEKLDMDVKQIDILRAMLVDSNVWFRPVWDPQAGPTAKQYEQTEVLDEEENPVLDDETGEPVMEETDEVREELSLGDVVFEILPAGSVMVEPGATEFEDAAWVIVTKLMRKDDAEARFDVEIKETDLHFPEESVPGFTPSSFYDDEHSSEDRVVIYEEIERPTKKYPTGRVTFYTNNRRLRSDALPKAPKGEEIEMVMLTAIRLVDDLLGTGPVAQVIPLQAEYNKQRSDMAENRKLMARPKWLVADGAMRHGNINSEPGQKVYWDPVMAQGHKPEMVKGVANSQAEFSELDLTKNEMDDVSSRHDISQGESSAQVTSGKHGQLLMGSDNSRYAPLMKYVEHGLGKFGKYLIRVVKRHMDDQRVMTITGNNYDVEIVEFMADDLDTECNVRYEILSQIPWNQEAQRQQSMWMYSQGMIDKTEAKRRLKLGLVDEIHEAQQRERLNARRENKAMAEFGYFPPMGTDNHEAHIEEHKEYINEPDNYQRIIESQLPQQQADDGLESQLMMAEMGMGDPMGMGPMAQAQEPQQPQLPPDITAILQHMEDHRKGIAPAQEEVKKILNVKGEIPPQMAMQEIAGAQAQPQEGVDGAPGATATPPGGQSGEAYSQPGPSVGESVGSEIA